jgi:hypothetical protein
MTHFPCESFGFPVLGKMKDKVYVLALCVMGILIAP